MSVDSKFFAIGLFFPDDEFLGSEDPPSGDNLCPPEIFCNVPGLASGVRERARSDSIPAVNVSRLPDTAGRLSDPLDLPKKEPDN